MSATTHHIIPSDSDPESDCDRSPSSEEYNDSDASEEQELGLSDDNDITQHVSNEITQQIDEFRETIRQALEFHLSEDERRQVRHSNRMKNENERHYLQLQGMLNDKMEQVFLRMRAEQRDLSYQMSETARNDLKLFFEASTQRDWIIVTAMIVVGAVITFLCQLCWLSLPNDL
ncbi:hypothetical protein GGS26DRAFT_127557 [Hypomontagnella submonticulosa]|nr:hypothetical protein GGS26DRAFT_127557 [Hypomontagnella submonticulosa]